MDEMFLIFSGPDFVVCDEGHVLKSDASGVSNDMNSSNFVICDEGHVLKNDASGVSNDMNSCALYGQNVSCFSGPDFVVCDEGHVLKNDASGIRFLIFQCQSLLFVMKITC